MFDFEKSVEIALRTWYPKDHELHFNPHLPLGKLLGEWGELLDDYMKSIYKPGYIFEPLDELGDIWYYLRILCHQRKYKPDHQFVNVSKGKGVDWIIATAISSLSGGFISVLHGYDCNQNHLDIQMTLIVAILDRCNITLQQLTDSNWEKLKPSSERGEQWARARVSTDYVRGKVAKGE